MRGKSHCQVDLPDTVKIAICVRRTIVVYYDIHPFNIDATSEDICGNENTLFERLESCVTVYPSTYLAAFQIIAIG